MGAVELKASMWTSFFMDLSPEDALKELSRSGWRHAELSNEHSRALLERGRPDAAGQTFGRFAEDVGVSVSQGHLDLPVDIAPADEAARRRAVEGLKPWLDLYVATGIRAAVLHPGGGKHENPALRTEERLRSIDELLEHVGGGELALCIENCPSGEEIKPLLERTDPRRVGVCLDTGHLNLTDENQGDFIRYCRARLRALHLAENDKSGDQHTMPYARGGCVPWEEIAKALADVEYAGLLNFEVPGERRCPLPVRRMKLDYLKELAAWIFSALGAP